jgi:hypothetical protein
MASKDDDLFGSDELPAEPTVMELPPDREMDMTGMVPANQEYFGHWKKNLNYKDLSLESDSEAVFSFFSCSPVVARLRSSRSALSGEQISQRHWSAVRHSLGICGISRAFFSFFLF